MNDFNDDSKSDLPESFKITKELMALQNDDISYVKELTMVKPIPAVILNYYTKAANPLFFADNISYQTQKEFELGYDPQTNHITIPIRDELGTLVGVKGRLFGTPQEGEPKYTYLEPCAKGRILYGLYKTLPYIKSNQKVYVGEAEKSVMQMWSMGVQNCVATGGKTISGAQVEMLTRLCVPIVFLFDKDVLPEELESLSNRFIAGTAVYAAIDTKDARELNNFFKLRCCNRAQWEIRSVADEMLKLVYPIAPTLFKSAGPGCVSCGHCTEGAMTCGHSDYVKEKYSMLKATAGLPDFT